MTYLRAILFSFIFIVLAMIGDLALEFSLILSLLFYLLAIWMDTSEKILLNFISYAISAAIICLSYDQSISLAIFVLIISLSIILKTKIKMKITFFIQLVLSILIYYYLMS